MVIMQPLAADLRDEDMRHLADYYAGMTPPSQEQAGKADQVLIEAGRKIALAGAPDNGIPACVACHGKPGYPRLAGQHAA